MGLNFICGTQFYFNPYYTICVYVGTDDNEPLKNNSTSKLIFQEIADTLCPKIDTNFLNNESILFEIKKTEELI